MSDYTIGEVSQRLALSPDTLRYYEKAGLLPPVGRSPGGTRRYGEADLARLRFIRRAQKMDFSLAEIGELLAMRESPGEAQARVRELTRTKLQEVEARLLELGQLRDELRQLIAACEGGRGDCCPILEGIENRGDRD